ncbi:phage head closure protein [Psychrobacter sp. 72-O-c]|uniref:phage head closure protein n=1 Tax=Psychrobacter sp. 72-O-c TaxID=2774125 RepID=UPI00191A39A2|nr:phage head closure protein [Psychrobacter sp. 72-O-c]
MKANKLRHRVTVYKSESTRSPSGAVLPLPSSPVVTLWASFEPLLVKDILSAQAADSETRARCVIRYRNDINSTMQIEHNGQRYEIDGDPLPDAKSGREHMTLMLKTV